jgi:hypothetical protein
VLLVGGCLPPAIGCAMPGETARVQHSPANVVYVQMLLMKVFLNKYICTRERRSYLSVTGIIVALSEEISTFALFLHKWKG